MRKIKAKVKEHHYKEKFELAKNKKETNPEEM